MKYPSSTTALIFVCILLNLKIVGQKEPVVKSIISDFAMAMALDRPLESQLDSIIRLSYRYLFHNQDTCLIVAKYAHGIAGDLYPNKKVLPDAMMQLGDAYRIRGELDSAEVLYHDGRALYMDLDLEGKAANADTKLGALYMSKGNYEESAEYHMSAMRIWEELRDTQYVFKPYINIAEVFYHLGLKKKAVEYNSKALAIAEKKNYKGVKMVALANQATIEKELAIEYSERADSSNNKLSRDSSNLYFQKAIDSYEYSIDVAAAGGNKRREAEFSSAIADLYIEYGDYDQAIAYGKNAKELSEQLGSNYRLAEAYYLLTKAHNRLKKYRKAIEFGKTALITDESKSTEQLRSSINYEIYEAYKAIGKYNLALQYLEENKKYESKINEREQEKTVADLEAKYQNSQKQEKILNQEKDILILKQSSQELTTQRNYIIGTSISLLLLGFVSSRWNKAQKEKKDKEQFAEALLIAQEGERKRIAQDLHDGIGQSLLLLKHQISENKSTTVEQENLIANTIKEVRSLSQELHPFQLEEFGLSSALESLLEKLNTNTQMFISSEIDKIEKDEIPYDHQINLYRSIQEGLSNILKHSEANACQVILQKTKSNLNIKIRDNGTGFNYEEAKNLKKCLGLKTMNERVNSIGGNISFKPGPNQIGTEINIESPINEVL